MLEVAACLFSVSCIAFLSVASRPAYGVTGAVTFAAAAASLVSVHGGLVGSLLLGVLLMSAASVLVLVLAPQPQLARPTALASGVLGALAVMLGSVLS